MRRWLLAICVGLATLFWYAASLYPLALTAAVAARIYGLMLPWSQSS